MREGNQRWMAIVGGLAVAVMLWTVHGWAQPVEPLSPEAREAKLEEAFSQLLEAERQGNAPAVLLQGSSVLMHVVKNENARRLAAGQAIGREHTREVVQRFLARWRAESPGSAAPDLFAVLQETPPQEHNAAILELLQASPDDFIVLWRGAEVLADEGQGDEALERTEAFLRAHPGHPFIYNLLYRVSAANQTRQLEVLRRWAEARPGNAAMLSAWLASPLAQRDPEATADQVAAYLDSAPAGPEGLQTCLTILEMGDAALHPRAERCVADLLATPSLPEYLVDQARDRLARLGILAPADGDPGDRLESLLAAAGGFSRQDCVKRIAVLTEASRLEADVPARFLRMASSLLDCAHLSQAEALYLELLGRAPEGEVSRVVDSWAIRTADGFAGRVPEGAAAVLEGRLARADDASELRKALDVVYQLNGPWDRRLENLRRWYDLDSETFPATALRDLAFGLLAADRGSEAKGLLEGGLARRFDREVATALWAVLGQLEGPEAAARFADRLSAGSDRDAAVGHLLAARSAVLAGDAATADERYRRALVLDRRGPEVAVEMLAALGELRGAEAAALVAGELCAGPERSGRGDTPEVCAADLLRSAGMAEAAAMALSASKELPDDPEALRKLAAAAGEAGDDALAVRALRKRVGIDPENEAGWVELGAQLEKSGRAEELSEVLVASRRVLKVPPVTLFRASARSLLAAGDPAGALRLWDEALAALPQEGANYSRRWIYVEKRDAFHHLGHGVVKAQTGCPECTGAVERLLAGDPAGAETLRRAAEARSLLAVETQALLVATGLGVKRNAEASRRLLDGAAELGSDGYAVLREQLESLPAYSELYGRALAVLEVLSEEGDTAAMADLARLHFVGGVVPRDMKRAAIWARTAARSGDALGMRVWSGCLLNGDGVEKDEEQGVSWLRRCAEAGEGFCMMFWSHRLDKGDGVPEDSAEAGRWLRGAAEAGNWWARLDLAYRYAEGRFGGEPDLRKAAEWMRRLAAVGSPEAAGWLAYHGLE